MQLESMYQEIILDHYRNPHGRGLRDPFDAEVHHVNPTCGDEVTLRVKLDGDTIADVSYEGMGCSISQASVSAMYDLVVGRTVPQALETGEHFRTLMQAKGDSSVAEKLEDELEDRFGTIPDEAARLLALARIRAAARALGIARIDSGPAAIALTPRHDFTGDVDAAGLVKKGDRLLLAERIEDAAPRLARLEGLLDELAA